MNNGQRTQEAMDYLNEQSDRIEAAYNAREIDDNEYAEQMSEAHEVADEIDRKHQMERETLAQTFLNNESDRIEAAYQAGDLNDTQYAEQMSTISILADEIAGRRNIDDRISAEERVELAQDYLARESDRIEAAYDARMIDDREYAEQLGNAAIIADEINSTEQSNIENNSDINVEDIVDEEDLQSYEPVEYFIEDGVEDYEDFPQLELSNNIMVGDALSTIDKIAAAEYFRELEGNRIREAYESDEITTDEEYERQMEFVNSLADEIAGKRDKVYTISAGERIELVKNYITRELDRLQTAYSNQEINSNQYEGRLFLVLTNSMTLTDGISETILEEYLEEEVENLRNTIENVHDRRVENVSEGPDFINGETTEVPIRDSEALKLLYAKEHAAVDYLAEAKMDYENSIAEFQRIFEEERIEAEKDIKTTEEYDEFLAKYMALKVAENDKFLDAKRRIEQAEKELESLRTQIERKVEFQTTARKVGLTPEQYENIVTSVARKNVLEKVLKNNGLGQIVGRIGNPSKEDKALIERVKQDIIQKLVAQQQKTKENINVDELINAIFNPEKVLRIEEKPKTLGVPTQQLASIEQTTKNLPQVVKNNNVKQKGTPGKAPIGIPVNKAVALIEDKQSKKTPPKKETKEILGLPGPVATEEKLQPKKEQPKPRRTARLILGEVTDEIDVTKKDGMMYRISNVKATESFKRELQTGNYLYNIAHLGVAVISFPIKLATQLAGKILNTAPAKERLKTIKERLDKLSDEDKQIVFDGFRNTEVNSGKFPTGTLMIINETMQEFANKKVAKINEDLEKKYRDVFTTIAGLDAIDKKLKTKGLSKKEKAKLVRDRENLLFGKADIVDKIRKGKEEGDRWRSGGSHGIEQDIKAATTNLSKQGKRFALKHDFDKELNKKETKLETEIELAIATNDDEKALRSFVEYELLQKENTKIENSIFGKRSTGKRYYSPLVEKLDYRDDPFVRDLFTTIALTGAAVSTINAIKVHGHDTNELLNQHQEEVTRINNANDQAASQVGQAGEEIVSKRADMMEGMKAQSEGATLSASEQIEVASLNKTAESYGDWALGTKEYRQYDNAGHQYYNDFYDRTVSNIQDIASKKTTGTITEHEAMEMLRDVANATNREFQNVTKECLDIMAPYAAKHPQFDLSSVESAMTYLVKNPDAIEKMNNAMVDVTSIGENLTDIEIAHFNAMTSLPSDLQTTLFGSASALALAYKVSNTMEDKYGQGTYGNAVTEMIDEYVANKEAKEQNNKSTSK